MKYINKDREHILYVYLERRGKW